jgi:hypothetical protein
MILGNWRLWGAGTKILSTLTPYPTNPWRDWSTVPHNREIRECGVGVVSSHPCGEWDALDECESPPKWPIVRSWTCEPFDAECWCLFQRGKRHPSEPSIDQSISILQVPSNMHDASQNVKHMSIGCATLRRSAQGCIIRKYPLHCFQILYVQPPEYQIWFYRFAYIPH